MLITFSFVVAPAAGLAGGAKLPHVASIQPTANSAPADWWENDGTQAVGWANPLTAYVPAEGAGFFTQPHTIDTALGDTFDQDWYYLDVDADEIAIDNVKFLVEAQSLDLNVDLVVEVYADGVSAASPVTASWGLDPSALASSDDAVWYTLNPSAWFEPQVAGRYWIRVRPFYHGGTTGFTGHAGAYTFKIQRTIAERIYGSDRVGTAVQVSKVSLATRAVATEGGRAILIANSMNYPDALSGAPLVHANGSGGSLLLTPQGSLPSTVAAEIVRSGTQYVYVLGGKSAVSDEVVWALEDINPGITVERVSGDDRIQTSNAIAREMYQMNGTRRFAIIAYAFNYPDALAATPVAVYNSTPILLTPKDALRADTIDALGDIGVTDIIIVGSSAVVSDNVFNQCAAYAGGADHVLRIAGANRYETAKEIALWSCDKKGPGLRDGTTIGTTAFSTGLYPLSTAHLGLASGENFPDALSGGVMCGINGFPILLTPKESPSPYIYDVYLQLPSGKTDFFNDAGSPPSVGASYVFGSSAAVKTLPLLVFSQMLGL